MMAILVVHRRFVRADVRPPMTSDSPRPELSLTTILAKWMSSDLVLSLLSDFVEAMLKAVDLLLQDVS
jgi:hypothetical protein